MAEERPDRANQPSRAPSLMQAAGQYLGYGLQWALATLLFLFLGLKADGWLRTTPLLTIIGAFVGAGAGFYSLYYHVVVEPRRRAEKEKRGEGPRQP